MAALNEFWQGLGRSARFGLILGASLILIATIALGAWVLRTDYQVLFADLSPPDAATMTAELEKIKTPYRLSGSGTTILVPADQVYKTRLKLTGKELPLRGAVGFELFNESEVGMTEFAQKINYQRALQGELTRTILSLEEVQSARVHLVLSEQGLFKKNSTQAKASITIAAKPGKTLDASQIQGIQRLVGAAVPDIKPNDVIILDQRGVAQTRRNAAEGEIRMSFDGLDDKRAIEAYLNKKVIDVLDRTFGAGQGIASVDVTLNHDNTKVTTENVLGANGDEQATTGIVVRERHTTRATASGPETASTTSAATGNAGLGSREVDYQVGRRVEQVVSVPGAVSHVNVAVVVRNTLSQAQLDRLKDVIAMAVGSDKNRGDAVAVYSVDQISSNAATNAGVPPINPATTQTASKMEASEASAVADNAVAPRTTGINGTIAGLFFAGVLALAVVALVWLRLVRHKQEPRSLSIKERDQLLLQVQNWLDGAHAPAQVPERI